MKGWMSARGRAGRWFDPALAGVLLVACEAEVVFDLVHDRSHHHWPVAANVIVVMFLTVPLAVRRRMPLASAITVKTSVLLLVIGLSDIKTVNFPQLVLFIAPYSVAAYSSRTRALVGLAYTVAALCAANLINPSGASSWVFSIGVGAGSWITGRIMRARRGLAAELKRTTDRLAAERGARELLAIADQRTRIARELQALVANSVSTMIVQTQAAQRLLDRDPTLADAAMATIEETGREAMTEMRRILGVLRHDDEPQRNLSPQPGIGQIASLVEHARTSQRHVELQVGGEPGPLPASVDLGIYRILEDAIDTVDDANPIDIRLRFDERDVELSVSSPVAVRLDWPTVAMRERAALCRGAVHVETVPGSGERLVVRLPRTFEGALA
jgi:signal transduction histidine kinase